MVQIGTRLSNHPLTQSAMQCTASAHTLHMPKPVIAFVFKVLRNALLRYFTHAQISDNVRIPSCPKRYAMRCLGTYFTHAQTCDNVRVRSATRCTASIHTVHILDGSSKNAIPLPLVCCFTPISDSTHVF